MATMNFSQMTTKKLNALLATASDEDKKAIEAVLAAREQAQAPAAPAALEATAEETPAALEATAEETQLSPEEEAAIKAAEENGGLNSLYNGSKATQEKKPKMTDEERHVLAEELKKNVNHRCQAVPFNTVEWVDGYIAGVIEEKRSNRVLYAIKADDGRRIVKVHDSNLVRILDEVVEPEKKAYARKAKDPADKIEWTPEAIAEEVNKVIGNVGKAIEFERYRTTDENGEEHIEMIVGRIVAIVPDKRVQRLLYRISVPAPIEGNPLATKTMYKVVKAEGIKIAEEFDEEGAQLNAKYLERREAAAATRTPFTLQSRVIHCGEKVKKAEEKLQKAQEELEAKKKQLEDAKKELDEYLAGQANEKTAEAPAEAITGGESLA